MRVSAALIISLSLFFSGSSVWADLASAPGEISLVAVGDIMPSGRVAEKMRQYGIDYPFLHVSDFLKSGDLTFANLESPITSGRRIKTGEMTFRSDPAVAAVLHRVGVSIVSLANNHTPNFGARGLLDTFKYLKENNIQYVGAGKDAEEAAAPAYVTVKEKTFAFLAYNDTDVVPLSYEAGENHPGTAFMRLKKMEQAVKAAKTKADFVIVSMHAGTEYRAKPNASQVAFAHRAIEAGAELVIGHHPHVVQTMEQYRGKYIFYSLGNFVFDQMWSAETRRGLALKIFFNENGVTRVSYHPVLISDFSQPNFLTGPAAAAVVARLR